MLLQALNTQEIDGANWFLSWEKVTVLCTPSFSSLLWVWRGALFFGFWGGDLFCLERGRDLGVLCPGTPSRSLWRRSDNTPRKAGGPGWWTRSWPSSRPKWLTFLVANHFTDISHFPVSLRGQSHRKMSLLSPCWREQKTWDVSVRRLVGLELSAILLRQHGHEFRH